MIVKLEKSSPYIEMLEILFTNVLIAEDVRKDIDENPFTNYFIYLVDNNPVAFINYFVMYERAELININVLEKFQNQKIASKLLECMMNNCAEKQVKSITLEVKVTNTKAIHLYQKYGWKEIGMRKGYYHGVDAILMEKELM